MFVIGNVKNHQPLENIAKAITTGGGGTNKIYGISVDRKNYAFTRLYDASNLEFIPSNYTKDTLTSIPVDQFNTAGSPFDIKFVMTEYNSETGQHDIIGTEDDANWMDLVRANTYGRMRLYDETETEKTDCSYNWMVRFPLFYYKRPDRNTFLVSSDPVDGFAPSPMHYRNGKLYQYAYISKFLTKSTGRSFNQQNSDAITLANAKFEFAKRGLRVMDYAAYSMIRILMFIKYGTFDINKIITITSTYPPTNYDTIKTYSMYQPQYHYTDYINDVLSHTKDFCIISGYQDSYRFNSMMGLSFYGGFYDGYPTFIDGLVGTHNRVYINNDLEAMKNGRVTSMDDIANQGWNQVGDINYNTIGAEKNLFHYDILYDPTYPYIFIGDKTGNYYGNGWGWASHFYPPDNGTDIYGLHSKPYLHSFSNVNLDITDLNNTNTVYLFRSTFVSDEITFD